MSVPTCSWHYNKTSDELLQGLALLMALIVFHYRPICWCCFHVSMYQIGKNWAVFGHNRLKTLCVCVCVCVCVCRGWTTWRSVTWCIETWLRGTSWWKLLTTSRSPTLASPNCWRLTRRSTTLTEERCVCCSHSACELQKSTWRETAARTFFIDTEEMHQKILVLCQDK